MLVIIDKLNFYLYKFWIFLKPRRKLGLVSFVILASLVVAVWVTGTNEANAGIGSDIRDMITNLIFGVAGLFIKLTFFILKFIIEVAGYNGFIDSPAVIVGWVMVRDVTNMFFVVVLLLISFGTILGLEQYEYKKLLVKLLMAAIIVNFSRIICGIIIDIAQVIMITFVNGVAATAGGNIVSMFGIDKIFKLTGSPEGVAQQGSTFLAAVAAITFSAIMMMTMLTFLFLLMARMLTLWILIVLSPLAFVLNVLPQTQKYAGQWWSEFGGNVVAGPIIAFFLWLSFVTVGAGNARDHIAAGNPQAFVEGADPKETSTGITDIMSWVQMANFAIAIGMLLTGAKIAQQLGAAGGAMMGKAGEFGKKVAMVASGVTAARWAGRGALAGAKRAGKFGLMKMPLVGGEAMQRRGRAIKAWAQYKTIKKGWFGLPSRESRLITAGKRIEMAYGETGKGRPFSRAWARAGLWIAPAAFKEEYTKDKEARAKYAEEQMEHIVSTSKTPIGKEKTEAEARLAELKETGQDIKVRKLQEMAEKSRITRDAIAEAVAGGTSPEELERSGQFTDKEIFNYKRWENANKSAVKAGQIKESIDVIRAKERAEEKEKLLSTAAGKSREQRSAIEKAATKQIEDQITAQKELRELEEIKKLLMGAGKNKQAVISFTKAQIENLKEDYEITRDESLAEARAKAFRGTGDDLRANQVLSEFQSKSAKREFDRAASMSWEDKTFALQTMPLKFQQIEKDIAAATTEADKKNFEEIRRKTIKRNMALATALKSEGKETSDLADREGLKSIGWTEVIDDNNRIRAELSKILGRVVAKGQEDAATKDIYDAYGGLEKAQGALTMYSNGNKIAGLKGAGSLFGLVGNRRNEKGQLEMFFNSQVNKEAGFYPTKEAEIDHRKWTTANGYAKINVDGKIVGFDKERAEQLAAIFSGKNELFISAMQNGFFDSLKNAEVNDGNKAEYEEFLRQVSKVLKDKKGISKFEERASELLAKLGAKSLPKS